MVSKRGVIAVRSFSLRMVRRHLIPPSKLLLSPLFFVRYVVPFPDGWWRSFLSLPSSVCESTEGPFFFRGADRCLHGDRRHVVYRNGQGSDKDQRLSDSCQFRCVLKCIWDVAVAVVQEWCNENVILWILLNTDKQLVTSSFFLDDDRWQKGWDPLRHRISFRRNCCSSWWIRIAWYRVTTFG